MVDDLRSLGVRAGDVLVVHSSMSSIGYVIGGAQTVVDALLACVGETGTVTMPAHSGDRSEPSYWQMPPVPKDWWPAIREHMPAFDPLLTPLRDMGAIAETFHRASGTLRSHHPRLSHVANGPHAGAVTGTHSLNDGFGEGSPLARLYELDARVLLIGVPHSNNTSLHLAESRAEWPGKQRIVQGSAVAVDGLRCWVTYEECDMDTDDFDQVGDAFNRTGLERSGPIGHASAKLMPQRALVDFASAWFTANRQHRKA